MARFSREEGYLRGVSPDDEVAIHFIPELTEIPASFKSRPGDVQWLTESRKFTLRHLEEMGDSWWRFSLDHVPVDPKLIKCTVTHDSIGTSGRKIEGQNTTSTFEHFEYRLDAGDPIVRVDVPTLAVRLRETGVKGPWTVLVKVDYPVP